MPANVCPVVPLAVRRAGFDAALVDVDPTTLAIDFQAALERARSLRGRLVLVFVRPYGAALDPTPLFAAAEALGRGILRVDDRCLCAPDPDAEALPLADLTLWSTGSRKVLDLGEGGFAVGRAAHPVAGSGAYDESARLHVEREVEAAAAAGREYVGDGGAAWLDERPASWTWTEYRRRILADLPAAVAHRERLRSIYEVMIPAPVSLPRAYHEWRYQIRIPGADDFVDRLRPRGLFAGRHYRSLGGVFDRGTFPAAAALHREIVNLFVDAAYDEARARATAELVRAHVAALAGGGVR